MSEIPWYEEQLAKARQEGNQKLMSTYLGSLGNLYAVRGDTLKGIKCLEEAIGILESLSEWDNLALAYKNIAACYEIGLHDLRTAVSYLEKAAMVASPDNPEKKVYESMAATRRHEMGLQDQPAVTAHAEIPEKEASPKTYVSDRHEAARAMLPPGLNLDEVFSPAQAEPQNSVCAEPPPLPKVVHSPAQAEPQNSVDSAPCPLPTPQPRSRSQAPGCIGNYTSGQLVFMVVGYLIFATVCLVTQLSEGGEGAWVGAVFAALLAIYCLLALIGLVPGRKD